MALRGGGFSRWNVQYEHIGKIAAPLEVNRAAIDAVARPGRGRDIEQIDAEILRQRDAFLGEPVEIRVDAISGLCLRQLLGIFSNVHRFLRHRLLEAILHARARPRYANNSDLITTGTTP